MTVRIRTLAGWLLLALVATLSAPLAADREWETVDWDQVRRDWKQLSVAERDRYMRLGEDRANHAGRSTTPGLAKQAAEECVLAEYVVFGRINPDAGGMIGQLPYADTNTTIGRLQNVNLSQFGACAGGGGQFTSTGTGPDLVYKVTTDIDCDLRVTLDPLPHTDSETMEQVPAEDLSLYVIGECSDPAFTCSKVSDLGGRGVSESLTFNALSARAYYIVVDGFAGSSGDYRMEVDEAGGVGCTLVPVELQSFTVE